MLELESEPAQAVAVHGVESCGDEDEVGSKSVSRGIDAPLKRVYVVFRLTRRLHRDIPDAAMRTAIRSCSRTRVPRPLVHRDEMNIRLILDQRLRSVSVVNVPVHDENPPERMALARVMSAEGDVPEEAESHGPIVKCVVSGRTDSAE